MADGKTFDIGASIKLENDKEFRDAVTGINKSIRTLDSELKLVSAQYEGNANSMEALSRKQEVLNRLLDEHKKKSEATKTALENAKLRGNVSERRWKKHFSSLTRKGKSWRK